MKKRTRILVSSAAAAVAVVCGISVFLAWGGRKGGYRHKEALVVDVFDSVANYQGIQPGWFAELVRDKFNMELNIIAPNVAGGGNTLYEIRSAAGNLGDLIICNGEQDSLQDMVSSGLLLDMEPYLKGRGIMRYKEVLEEVNAGIEPKGIYVIPSELSVHSPLTPKESMEPVFGPYIRWDLYKAAGYPEIHTLEDLLPVLKKMQDLEPAAENGAKTYAFSFFKDWDGNMMTAAKQPCCFYGYDEFGFGLEKADGSDFQSIIASDSMYVRALKLYFEANRMGLVDPESPVQSYTELEQKYEEGRILYSPWPWQAQQKYNTLAHKEEGKGFMLVDIEDMRIYSNGCNHGGNRKLVIGIGARAGDPERLAAFIDWFYSPDGIASNGVQSSAGTAGPRGLSWDYDEEGKPYLTEFGWSALLDSHAELPEEWGGGTWAEGISRLNFMPVAPCESDDKGYPYAYLRWDSVAEMHDTALDKDWKEHMGADNVREFLEENGRMTVSAGCDFVLPAETSEISTLRGQCKKVIQKYSWEMIFAEDEEEFYALLGKLQEEAVSLGYEEVLAVDRENVEAYREAREKAVEAYEYMAR